MPLVLKMALDLNVGPAVELRMRERGFETVEDYVRSLIADDLEASLPSDLESLLSQRLAAHDYVTATPELWADLEQRVRSRLQRERAAITDGGRAG